MSTSTDKSETIYINCECHSPQHIICVDLHDNGKEEAPDLYFELQADRSYGFFKRLQLAFFYIFGSANLEWHDVIPDRESAYNLHRLLVNYLKLYKAFDDHKN
jgi:hypothetical protein